jgi:hypothetical protein
LVQEQKLQPWEQAQAQVLAQVLDSGVWYFSQTGFGSLGGLNSHDTRGQSWHETEQVQVQVQKNCMPSQPLKRGCN